MKKNKTKFVTSSEKNNILHLYLKFYSVHDIGKKLNRSPATVLKVVRNSSIFVPQSSDKKRISSFLIDDFWLPLSNKLIEVIEGELLGDGNIRISVDEDTKISSLNDIESAINVLTHHKLESINLDQKTIDLYNKAIQILLTAGVAHFRLHKSTDEYKWTNYLVSLFIKDKHPVNIIKWKTVRFHSKNSFQLYDIYKKWYINKKKSIPTNFNLTPTKVLHWFIGDGSSSKYRIVLSNESFSEHENRRLKELLECNLSIKVKLRKYEDYRTNSIYNRLEIIGKKNFEKFWDYLKKDLDGYLLAKEVFPWKFVMGLKKKDYLLSRKKTLS